MRTRDQLLRFLIVGAASNAALYVLYLGATSLGIGHKIAMTVLFAVGVVQTFVFNKTWSFRSRGNDIAAFARYASAYLLAYIINLTAMLVLVDCYHFSDRLVQAVMIILVAMFMFGMQRYWVFPASRHLFAKK